MRLCVYARLYFYTVCQCLVSCGVVHQTASSDLLLSYSITSLAQHITNILISALKYIFLSLIPHTYLVFFRVFFRVCLRFACRMFLGMCPEGAEGSSYAMLTTLSNLAGTVAYSIAAALSGIWDVSIDTLENKNYDGMYVRQGENTYIGEGGDM